MYRKDKKSEFFTIKAREEGYPARSVYKLQEIDKKYQLIKKGSRVLDLGCAPGSWLLYLSKKVGDTGRVKGFDIEDIKIPLQKNIIFIKKDVLALENEDIKGKYDAVVSDLAPSTSGMRDTDAERSLELCQKAFEIASTVLSSGGNFLCKVLDGESTNDFFKKINGSFRFAKRFRPKAVRKGSREIYIIARGFKKV